MFDRMAFTLSEGIDFGDCIVATYLYQTSAKADIHKLAVALSEEQSSGTWVSLPHETDVVRQRHVGKIVAIWEVPDHEVAVPDDAATRDWVLQIAYPVHSIGPQIPLMLTTVHGNLAAAGRLKLLDIHFPKSYSVYFRIALELLGKGHRPAPLPLRRVAGGVRCGRAAWGESRARDVLTSGESGRYGPRAASIEPAGQLDAGQGL